MVVSAFFSREDQESSDTKNDQILRSLSHPICWTAQRLVISCYYIHAGLGVRVAGSPIFQVFSVMHNLRTPELIGCKIRPFVLALDLEQNPSGLILCPSMEKIAIFIFSPLRSFEVEPFIGMAKNRTSRGARISSVLILGQHRVLRRKEVLELREHVTHFEYRVDSERPGWDFTSGADSDGSEDSYESE